MSKTEDFAYNRCPENEKGVQQRENTKGCRNGPDDEIDFEEELYRAFGQIADFTLGMRIARYFYNLAKKNIRASVKIEELTRMEKKRPDDFTATRF